MGLDTTIQVYESTPEVARWLGGEVEDLASRLREIEGAAHLNPELIARELTNGAFWKVLSLVDGDVAKREEALRVLGQDDLVRLLTVCANQAITFPGATNLPGSSTGHSALYEHFSKPGSLVRQFAPPIGEVDFGRDLANGAFWESLAEMRGLSADLAGATAGKILIQDFSKLGLKYVRKGIYIMTNRDSHQDNVGKAAPDLTYLPLGAVPNYGEFFGLVDSRFPNGLPMDKAKFRERFFEPYVRRVLGRENGSTPNFPLINIPDGGPNVDVLLRFAPCMEVLGRDMSLALEHRRVSPSTNAHSF